MARRLYVDVAAGPRPPVEDITSGVHVVRRPSARSREMTLDKYYYDRSAEVAS